MVYSAETGSIPTDQTASSAPQREDWQARYIELYDCLSEMAKRWEKAVFDHSLEPTFGEDEYVKQNRRVLFDCRPLADFETHPERYKVTWVNDASNVNDRRMYIDGQQWAKVYGWDWDSLNARCDILDAAMKAAKK